MPDTAELEMPGSSQGKGVPGWLMVVGAVAGVAGLVLLLKGSGGGGGTTAAGTSINAALGSIQEENMNLLGVTQAGFMGLGQQVDTGFGTINTGMTQGFLNTQQGMGALGSQMATGFSDTQGLLGTIEHDIQAQLSAFSGQTQSNFNNMNALLQSGQASATDMHNAEMSLIGSVQNDVSQGLVGQQQANALLNTVSGQVTVVGGQISDTWGPLTYISRGVNDMQNRMGLPPT